MGSCDLWFLDRQSPSTQTACTNHCWKQLLIHLCTNYRIQTTTTTTTKNKYCIICFSTVPYKNYINSFNNGCSHNFFFFLNSKLSSEEELRHLGRFWSNSTMLNWFVRSLKIIHILWRCSYLFSVSASSCGVFPLLEMDDAQSQLLWQSNSSLSNRRGRFG